MADAALGVVVRYLRRVAVAERGGTLSDAQLLKRYIESRDEAAFEVLVWRHGILVFGLCKKLLRNNQDAEDAFQAVFLILARKPPSRLANDSLGGWLHQVAWRTGLRLRRQTQKRRSRERQDPDETNRAADTRSAPTLEHGELWGAVMEELQRLPDRYREPVVSCYLQGKTHVEMAQELSRPAGSMSRVLDRGCRLLNARLTRRGVSMTAGALAALLGNRSYAALPPALVQRTVNASLQFARGLPVQGLASSLAHTAIRGMMIGKLKAVATLFLLICVLSGGALGLAHHQQMRTDTGTDSGEWPISFGQRESTEQPKSDAFGDLLPSGAVSRLGTVRWRHGSQITCVAVSPDGKKIVSGGLEGCVRLWDPDTGMQVGSLRNVYLWGIEALAFSPDGRFIALTSRKSGAAAELWDVGTESLVRRFELQQKQPSTNLAFSPDGTTSGGGKRI